MQISGTTKLAGLFAHPAKHSQSPMIHNTAFKMLDIDAVYLAFDVDLNQNPHAIKTIKDLEMMGVNLSMPNKHVAKELVDDYSEIVSLVGAVNTIVHEKGRLIGHNTDGIGLMQALDAMDCHIFDKKLMVIGTGGASLSIIAQAALDGAKRIHVFNRKSSRVAQRLPVLEKIANVTGCDIQFHYLTDEKQLKQAVDESEVLINATNVGMGEYAHEIPIPVDLHLPSEMKVMDIIYHPRETKFLEFAKSQGCQTDNGLSMLVYQASEAFRLWTHQIMPVNEIKHKMK